ncbi:PTS mannose/fructose/sorbose/N-acetylgalactosamine transporter subunit IIC [Enterococcus crotali]|uniref:PTS mannose/fructose/sorbose/N-acetylgalactosamine transporter subunit IIC n=1 Tax=Enterococcus crotali TaxID=1453587 RepID=UPI00046EDA11|nr:PTS sugar transporter subunit IIC [Enterococcus crotali]
MQIFLVSVWAFICSVDDSSTQMIRRPLMICTVVGLIMGDLSQGLLIGATLEVMWMGIGNVGAYTAPDVVSGSVISCALSIASGGGVATAVTLAVPTSILAQQLIIVVSTVMVALNPYAAKLADQGDVKGTNKLIILPTLAIGLVRAVPTFLAMQFGSGIIEKVVAMLPEVVMTGLGTAGKIIPAVGIAVLMNVMIKDGKMWIFLLLGWVLTSYLKLDVLPVTIISLAFAFLFDLASSQGQVVTQHSISAEDDIEGIEL